MEIRLDDWWHVMTSGDFPEPERTVGILRDEDDARRFMGACALHEQEIVRLQRAVWTTPAGKERSRNFSKLEKFLRERQREAQIVDS